MTLKEVHESVSERIRAAVVGARGYSGLELCRLLLQHPKVEFIGAFATGKFDLSDFLSQPQARFVPAAGMEDLPRVVHESHVQAVFLATPAEASAEWAPKILEMGVDVIDLSGAFRLQTGDIAASYKEWYRMDHPALGLVQQALYGLSPWCWQREASNASADQLQPTELGGRLIANPGCFATSILMALVPLMKDQLIDPTQIVVDSKSGSTGAGKKAEERLLHSEVSEQIQPYRIGRHQHLPEILQFLKKPSGSKVKLQFTPHLMSFRRGILSSIYLRPSSALMDLSDVELSARIGQSLNRSYERDPLVRITELTAQNEGAELALRRVVGTAQTRIAFKVQDGQIYLFSMIDNLMKGAASQAIENFNCLYGWEHWFGLDHLEGSI